MCFPDPWKVKQFRGDSWKFQCPDLKLPYKYVTIKLKLPICLSHKILAKMFYRLFNHNLSVNSLSTDYFNKKTEIRIRKIDDYCALSMFDANYYW